jgi:hypothetical protein
VPVVFSGPPAEVRSCCEEVKKLSDALFDTHIVLAIPGKVYTLNYFGFHV